MNFIFSKLIKRIFDNKTEINKKQVFILVTSLCYSCLNAESSETDLIRFKKRCSLLNNFISENENIQMKVLEALECFDLEENSDPQLSKQFQVNLIEDGKFQKQIYPRSYSRFVRNRLQNTISE